MLTLHEPVIYVTPTARAVAAILVTIWGNRDDDAKFNVTRDSKGNIVSTEQPDCTVNLVYTSDDESRTDNGGYGRQIERASSCVHMSRQDTRGNYWRRYIETGKPSETTSMTHHPGAL